VPARFETLGPFELTRKEGVVEASSLNQIWKEPRDLRYGVGVYIIASRKRGKLVPWYVGRSDRGFASRLNRHSIFEKIYSKVKRGSLFLFLIARVTTKTGSLKKALRRHVESGDSFRSFSAKLKSINRLEFALIGSCMAQNEDLLNLQEKAFHRGLIVPGYLNDSNETLTSPAEELGKMLGAN